MTRQDSHVQASSNDFKVEVPEFEGKLDPEDFLDWLHTDGGPSLNIISSPQGSSKGSSFMAQVQEISQACQENSMSSHGVKTMHKPGFVHVIS